MAREDCAASELLITLRPPYDIQFYFKSQSAWSWSVWRALCYWQAKSKQKTPSKPLIRNSSKTSILAKCYSTHDSRDPQGKINVACDSAKNSHLAALSTRTLPIPRHTKQLISSTFPEVEVVLTLPVPEHEVHLTITCSLSLSLLNLGILPGLLNVVVRRWIMVFLADVQHTSDSLWELWSADAVCFLSKIGLPGKRVFDVVLHEVNIQQLDIRKTLTLVLLEIWSLEFRKVDVDFHGFKGLKRFKIWW